MASLASPPLPNSTSWTFNNKIYQKNNHKFEADAENYYGGLPTHPLLVATTSYEIPPWGQWPNKKLLQPIGSKHKINQLWYRGSPLIRKVLETLQGHDWTAVDILMVNCQEGNKSIRMLISVETGSMEWHTGIWVAVQCKKTLEDFNIKDIEVEIKEPRADFDDDSEDEIEESNITGAGQPFVPPPHEVETKVPVPQTPFLGLPDDLFHKNECIKEKIQISRHLGTQIFPEGNKQAGTKGLYLQVMPKNAKKPVFVALTCRHFVFTENSDTNLGGFEYLWTPQKPNIWMNQLLQNRFKGIKDQIDRTVAGLEERRRELAEATEKSDQLKAKIFEASLNDSDYNDLKQIQKHLAQYEGESSRRFGHVVYAAAQSTAPAGWLRNYALISLDAVAHDGRIPGNTVWAPQMFSGCDVEYLMNTWGDRNTWGYDWPNQPTIIELSGHLTLKQIRSPDKYLKDAQTIGDEKDQLIVGMVGARSDWRGTRFGIVNNVQSLTRHITKGDDCRESISMELCVTSMERSCFSTNMDSGACVFSLDGRVVGIVAGYTSADPSYADVTYVTTLENIIADLKNAGIDASLYRLPEQEVRAS